jgi:hypothetical protein
VTDPAALGRSASALAIVSVASFATVAVLGPSVASSELDGAGPTRSLGWGPPDLVVTGGMWAAVLTGAASVVLGWLALRRGWSPPVRRVVVLGMLGAVLLAAVPPLGSTDVLSYGAYGRMAVLGLNPYTTTVNDLVATGDPVGVAYDGAWPDTPAVYGPVAVGLQGAMSWLSGSSMRWFVLLMQLAALAAFAATAWLLLRVASPGGGRERVAWLWAANPLVMYLVVNGAHIDGLAVALGVAALVAVQRSPAAAGVLVALSVCTKISFALYAAALVWAVRRARPLLVRLVSAGAVTGAVLLVPFLPELVAPLRTASQLVARASVWYLVDAPLRQVLPEGQVHALLSLAAWALMAVVVWRLSTALPRRDTGAHHRDVAIRAAALLGTGWLLTSTYALPWYDVIAWAPLLLLPASGVDLLLVARTALVAVAYVPGVVARPAGMLGSITSTLRGVVAPAGSLALVALSVAAPGRLRLRPPAERRRPASSQ